MTIFKDYPAQVFNWATHHEAVSLPSEVRSYFHGKAVLGGFENGEVEPAYGGRKAALTRGNQTIVG